jgi:hypothetical protein
MALFRKGLEAGSRVRDVQEVRGALQAAEAALQLARPGELLLIQADQIDETVEYLKRYLASGDGGRQISYQEALAMGQPADLDRLVGETANHERPRSFFIIDNNKVLLPDDQALQSGTVRKDPAEVKAPIASYDKLAKQLLEQ